VSSLISGSAETPANFPGGQTLRSGGLCSMSSVRQAPAEIRLFGNDFQRSPASLDGASFFSQGANDVSRRELVSMMGLVGA